VVSFFENNGLHYAVALDTLDGIVGFGVSDNNTSDLDYYSDERFITSHPMAVFGKVFFILTHIITKTNTSFVKFDSANVALGRIYDKLVKNKFFIKALTKLGFEYDGNVDGYYTFTKNH
jgi:hypothetical protein